MSEDARDRFAKEVGDDAVQALFEAFYEHLAGKPDTPPFSFSDVNQINACNYRFMAFYDAPNGEEWCVTCADGDFGGSEVLEFSKDVLLELEEHRPTIYSFKPTKWLPQGMFGVYLAWRKEPWFQEMERSYNYDRFFAPGGKTETHYRDKAAKRGLTIATVEDCNAYVARGPMTADDIDAVNRLAAMLAPNHAP